jgi:hypothetical protein
MSIAPDHQQLTVDGETFDVSHDPGQEAPVTSGG